MSAVFSIIGFFLHLFFELPWFIQLGAVFVIVFICTREAKSARRGIEGHRADRYYNKVKPRVEQQDRERRFNQTLAAHEEVASRWNKRIARTKNPQKRAMLEESRDKELRVTGHLMRARRISPATGEPTKGIRREGKH